MSDTCACGNVCFDAVCSLCFVQSQPEYDWRLSESASIEACENKDSGGASCNVAGRGRE